MRYLFMDNQLNVQEPVNQTLANPEPVVPKIPTAPVTEIPSPIIPETPISKPELPPLQPQPEIDEVPPSNEYQEVLDQYAATQTKAPIPENEPQPNEPTLSDFGITDKPPQNNIFKILFIFALIIFVLVGTALAFVYFKSQNNSTSSNSNINKSTPTPISTGSCSLNDRTYSVGESFAAADGCNTCTCESQNTVTCTDKKCLTTPTATTSATVTPVSTSSAKKTSTSSAVIK